MPSGLREPFTALFLVGAVVLALLVIANRASDADSDATFAGARPTVEDVATPQPLPTPAPTPLPDPVATEVTMVYSAESIVLDGVVPAQPIADALVAAATRLLGEDAVSSQLSVDPTMSPGGVVLIISGEIADEDERARVLAAFDGVGVTVRDEMIIAGSDRSILEVVEATEDLSQMFDFLAASGVANELSVEGETFTLLAPTNAAIEALDVAALTELSQLDQLTEVTRFHVVPGMRTERDLRSVEAVSTLQGESLAVSVDDDGSLVIAGARVTTADIIATNGVVHVIDAVMLPGTLATEIALNRIVELDPVQFSPGSADLLDASLPILDQAAAILVENPVGRVEIHGHTDTDGPDDTNLQLSQDRAEAVRDYLVERGVDAARLTALGFGETQLLVDPEETDADKAANRRIEFRVN